MLSSDSSEAKRQKTLNSAKEALERVRALRRSGIAGLHLHEEDVEGTWLEDWQVEENTKVPEIS